MSNLGLSPRAPAAWRSAGPFVRLLFKRIAVMLMTLLGLMTLVFLMIKLIPGDEAQVAAGPEASPEQVVQVRQRLGLDQPLLQQYVRFLGRVLQGDLGTSVSTLQPVVQDIGKVLPSTLELVALAMVLSLLVAAGGAIAAASRRDRGLDVGSRVAAVVLTGIPAFWLALLAQNLFGAHWNLLPISGQQSFEFAVPQVTRMPLVDTLLAGNLPAFFDAVRHIVLPTVCLAAFFCAQLFRTLRASLIAILESDFIAPVRAKGASFQRIMLHHALPNAVGPTITLLGMQLGMMIGSAVLVEGVFGRQGVGAYLANGVAQKDTAAVLGAVLFIGAIVCVVNLLVDVLQLALDPRVRASQLKGRGA